MIHLLKKWITPGIIGSLLGAGVVSIFGGHKLQESIDLAEKSRMRAESIGAELVSVRNGYQGLGKTLGAIGDGVGAVEETITEIESTDQEIKDAHRRLTSISERIRGDVSNLSGTIGSGREGFSRIREYLGRLESQSTDCTCE